MDFCEVVVGRCVLVISDVLLVVRTVDMCCS